MGLSLTVQALWTHIPFVTDRQRQTDNRHARPNKGEAAENVALKIEDNILYNYILFSKYRSVFDDLLKVDLLN